MIWRLKNTIWLDLTFLCNKAWSVKQRKQKKEDTAKWETYDQGPYSGRPLKMYLPPIAVNKAYIIIVITAHVWLAFNSNKSHESCVCCCL